MTVRPETTAGVERQLRLQMAAGRWRTTAIASNEGALGLLHAGQRLPEPSHAPTSRRPLTSGVASDQRVITPGLRIETYQGLRMIFP